MFDISNTDTSSVLDRGGSHEARPALRGRRPEAVARRPHPYGQRAPSRGPTARRSSRSSSPTSSASTRSWHVEHHFREGRSHSPAPEVLIGALSQCTEQIRLGFGVTLMPHAFTPPMRVAEKVATADVLSGGRVEWGTGRSTPMEQTAFGVDREAQPRPVAARPSRPSSGMWESEYFEFHGKYLDFPRRMVTPKPVQDPHPPCWMAATSDGSAAVAGSLGLGLLSFSILQPIERMAQHIEPVPAGAAEPEPITRVTTNKVAAYTLVHCAETMAQCRGQRHLGLGVVVVQEPRRVHPRVGVAPLHPGGAGHRSSRCSGGSWKATSTPASSTTPT